MKISTLVDSNVLIDVLGFDGPTRLWSLAALKRSVEEGEIVLSAIVWAELAHPQVNVRSLSRAFEWLQSRREDFPFIAAHAAGVAHRLYRQRGGLRDRTLPDFMVGAHAAVTGHRLLTRDATRYRSYFPNLAIIAPDTHP